jgi:predicted transcriptional regulator of viral defense system
MNLYQIAEALKHTRRCVFTPDDLCRITGLTKGDVYVYINRMLKRGLIFRVERGKVAICKDPFIISSQLVFPAYISFITALYLHGKIQQTINNIFVATSRKRKPQAIFGVEVSFATLKPDLMFGYQKEKKGESYISLATSEKAVIDILYLPRYTRIACIPPLLRDVDVEKLIQYTMMTGSEAVTRRLGYLLDLTGIEHDLKLSTKTIYKLNPSINAKGKLNRKWLLYINEEVAEC